MEPTASTPITIALVNDYSAHLVAVLEAIYAGDIVISDLPVRARSIGGLNRPGQSEGLTDRESEILRWSRLVGGRGSGCSG